MSDIKTRKRPEMPLVEAQKTFVSPKGVQKKFTSLKAVEGETKAPRTSLLEPTDEEVAKINEFTRSNKTADQLAVFKTYSCNDMYDRDDDGFRRGAIQQMKSLEEPFSFTGKSFMVSHDYSKLPIGRIFETDSETIEGAEFLTNKVYIPRTASNEGLIENVDFGVYWAVSVGLVLESSACSICDQPFGYWTCKSGHMKSDFYDPTSDEKDDWGYPIAADPDNPNAVKCQRDLYDPSDGYELSMCFLGAQYGAELAKKPGFASIMKAASARTLPIIGLSSKEAEEIDMPEEAPEVQDARKKFKVTLDGSGDATWVDDQGLAWVYNETTSEAMCLGRSAEDDGSTTEGQELGAVGEDHSLGGDVPAEDAGIGEDGPGDPEQRLGGRDEEPVEEKRVSKTQILAAANKAAYPKTVIQAIEGVDEGSDLDTLLLHVKTAFESETKALIEKAAMGDRFIASKRATAISLYVKARQSSDAEPISTTLFGKMLERFGDDLEMLDEVIAEQQALCNKRFPTATRRSTFERDANQPDLADVVDQQIGVASNRTALRIHG